MKGAKCEDKKTKSQAKHAIWNTRHTSQSEASMMYIVKKEGNMYASHRGSLCAKCVMHYLQHQEPCTAAGDWRCRKVSNHSVLTANLTFYHFRIRRQR